MPEEVTCVDKYYRKMNEIHKGSFEEYFDKKIARFPVEERGRIWQVIDAVVKALEAKQEFWQCPFCGAFFPLTTQDFCACWKLSTNEKGV